VLAIENKVNKELFINQLKRHQRGETDYIKFCEDCAQTGIEKWIVDLNQFTCIYYDKAGNEILRNKFLIKILKPQNLWLIRFIL